MKMRDKRIKCVLIIGTRVIMNILLVNTKSHTHLSFRCFFSSSVFLSEEDIYGN